MPYSYADINYTFCEWLLRVSNPDGGEIFRNRLDRRWDPPRIPYGVYRVSFPEVNQPGRGVDHPPHLALGLNKVEPYLYPPVGHRGLLQGEFNPLNTELNPIFQ